MTAIPATLASAEDADAVQITLDSLSRHTLTQDETREDILLLFDIDLTTQQARHMSGYLGRVLSMVRAGEMRAAEAAKDIRQVVEGFQAGQPDAQYELNLS